MNYFLFRYQVKDAGVKKIMCVCVFICLYLHIGGSYKSSSAEAKANSSFFIFKLNISTTYRYFNTSSFWLLLVTSS